MANGKDTEVDYNNAGLLLHIIDKAKDWPTQLKGLHDKAMKDLMKMSKTAGNELVKEKAEEDAALAKVKADQLARDQAQSEADIKAYQKAANFKPEQQKPAFVERESFKSSIDAPPQSHDDESIQRRSDI